MMELKRWNRNVEQLTAVCQIDLLKRQPFRNSNNGKGEHCPIDKSGAFKGVQWPSKSKAASECRRFTESFSGGRFIEVRKRPQRSAHRARQEVRAKYIASFNSIG